MDRLTKLIERLRPDRLTPSTAVFPDIDVDALARDLHIEGKALSRAGKDLPASSDNTFDPVEQEIVAAVSELRRKALNSYEEHLQTYARRLREAQDARTELKTIAGVSRTDFHKARVDWENILSNARQRVAERHAELVRFRQENRVHRTAYERWPTIVSIGFAAVMVVVESMLNGYFFAKGNELGLLGGISVALVISILNVGVSLIAGYFSRNIVHVHAARKVLGLATVFAFLGFAVLFNFAVAHFRDAAGYLAWDEAVTEALRTLSLAPLVLRSIESWLLIGIGLLICGVSFWKGWALDDPYPGYGRVHRGLEEARDVYAADISGALDELQELRDGAVEDLRDARAEISAGIREAIDVLYARRGLREQREVFLEHVNQSVNRLLAIYREHNNAARKSDPPGHFSREFAFEKINPAPLPEDFDREAAQKDLTEMNAVIDETIKAIFDDCAEAIESFPRIGDLERASETPHQGAQPRLEVVSD